MTSAPTPSRRLLALMCAAVVGVLLALGVLVGALAGLAGVLAYAAVAVVLVGVAAVRGRRLLAPPPLPPGRTCTCCTTTHFDPVKVI